MKRKKKHNRRHKRPEPKAPSTTAIVKAAPVTIVQHNRERRLRTEEVELLQKTVAKGTTPDEFLYFMTVCRKHRIDPFTKQIYCIVWPTNNGQSHEVVIIMGIGGYRMTAARDHKDFAGTSSAVFTWPTPKQLTPAKRSIPESATVRALRKGGDPAEATVYWEEFAPADLAVKRSDFWNRMPKHMLAKCAEALAIRKAFPDLSDIYTEEEVSQRLQDLTPGGREITVGGVNPSGRIVEQPRVDSKLIADAKINGDWCGTHNCLKTQCPSDEHTAAENEEVFQRKQAKKQQAAKPAAQPPAKAAVNEQMLGTVEIDWTDNTWPIVRGDIGNLLEIIKKHCNAQWGQDSWWHVQPQDVKTIKQMCRDLHYKLVESYPAKSSGSREAKPETKTKPASEGAGAKQIPAGTALVKGIIERVISGTTGNNAPLRQVTILMPDKKKPTFACFDKPLFEHLEKGNGKEAEIYIQTRGKYTNIVGLKRIGAKEFDTDGKTPCVQRKDQEAGGKTLFS